MWQYKQSVKKISIKPHTPQWYEFRKSGIGSSEIGSLMGVNRYNPAIVLYHQKVGDLTANIPDNEPMFHGRNLESYIAKCWSFYGGDNESMVRNGNEKRQIRKPLTVNSYFTNKKYPNVFVSPDRIFSGVRIDTGEPIELGILECKMISSWESQKWESGVPPSYMFQVQLQMMVMEVKYAEICALHDGNKIRVYTMDYSPVIGELMWTKIKDFWGRIVPAREAWESYLSGKVPYEFAETIIQKYEPEPDGSEMAEKFLSERYKKLYDESIATDEDEVAAETLRSLKEEIKTKEDKKNELENYFRQRFGVEKSGVLICSNGKQIKASKRANANKITISV